MTNLDLFSIYSDSRTNVILRDRNGPHLERVSEKIRGAIIQFCRRHAGQEFHADELRRHVLLTCGEVAPGSPDRVLRDLRQKGLVNYVVVDRRKSLYRIV